jgi:hypothetical protein
VGAQLGTAVREMSKKGGRSGRSKSEVAGRDLSCLDVKVRILAWVDWAMRPRASSSFDTRLLFRRQNQYRRVAGSSVARQLFFPPRRATMARGGGRNEIGT